MVTMDAEECDWQLAYKLLFVEISPSTRKIDSGIAENNYNVSGFCVHASTEMSNALKVAVSIAGQINHKVPPVYHGNIIRPIS